MRLLHTADWHVGKTLRGRSRADEHRAVLSEIASIARERDVDVVLVAGDLFETAAPTPESEQIVYAGLLEFVQTGASVVLISGNHDNPRRLAAIRPLLDLTKIHALPELTRPDQGGVLTVPGRGGSSARIAMLPFLSQRSIVKADELMAQDAGEHAMAYADRTARIIAALCAGATTDTVNIVLAHAMVHGGTLGGGERSAHTVFDYSIPTTAFPASCHYVALGHLHRPQSLPGGCPIWYSGSPLQLDFGETQDSKSVNLIEAEPGRPARITQIPLASGRRLRRVRVGLSGVEGLAESAGDDFLQVIVEAAPQPGLADQIREVLPNAVEVRISAPEELAVGRNLDQRAGRAPQQLFSEYLAERGEDDDDVRELFGELLEEVHAAEAS